MTVRRYRVHLFRFLWLPGGVHGNAEAVVQRGGSWEHSKRARLTMNTEANLLRLSRDFIYLMSTQNWTFPLIHVFMETDFIYGYLHTWSLTLREGRKLRVFENMVLRRIFGSRSDEVTGEWRRMHNEELNDLYCSPSIVRVIKSRGMRWAGHVARIGEERGVYRVLVGKPEGKRPLGRPRRRWVDNIRMDLQEVGCWCMDWIGLAQDRDRWRTLVSAVMNLRVP